MGRRGRDEGWAVSVDFPFGALAVNLGFQRSPLVVAHPRDDVEVFPQRPDHRRFAFGEVGRSGGTTADVRRR